MKSKRGCYHSKDFMSKSSWSSCCLRQQIQSCHTDAALHFSMTLYTLEFKYFIVFQLLSHVLFCYPMDCSTSDFPVLHHLLELAQTNILWVSDAIQPSHTLLFHSPPAFNLSQYQVFSTESALHIRWPILKLQLQHQSFRWIFRDHFL